MNKYRWFDTFLHLFHKDEDKTARRQETIHLGLQRMEDRQVLSVSGAEVMLFSVGDSGLNLPNGDQAETADIIQYDGSDFEILFDGSAAGLSTGANIDAFAYLGDNQFLFSFSTTVSTALGDSFTASDLVLFEADSLGAETSGQFSLFLDGNVLGLNSAAGNIDALDVLDDGSLILSTEGNIHGFNDEDLFQAAPDAAGNFSVANLSLYFDGSDVDLSFPSEEIDAVSVNDPQIHFSTQGGFGIGAPFNIFGSDEDVLTFTADSLGEDTSGSYRLSFDGSLITGQTANLNALDFAVVTPPSNPPTAGSFDLTLDEDTSVTSQLQGDDGDADADQTLTYHIVDGPDSGAITNFDPATGTFTYTPGENFNGSDEFTYIVEEVDANGNVLTSGVATVRLNVQAVNDAPLLEVLEPEFSGNQGEAVLIQGLSVGDVEAAAEGALLTVVLSTENGTVAFANVPASVEINGNGTGELTLSGTVAEINALLASGVTFTPAAEFFGAATMNVVVSDGADPATGAEASGTVQIQVQENQDPGDPPGDPDPSDRNPSDQFRDRINELVEAGELRPGIGRRLLRAVENDGSLKQINKGLRRINRLERFGLLDADAADELRGYLQDAKDDILEDRDSNRCDRFFAKFGQSRFLRHLARLRCCRR